MTITEFVEKKHIKAAVFDMDGTLTDSMTRWAEIYAVLSEYLGGRLPDEFLMRYNHLSMRRRVEELAKETAGFDADTLYKKWLAATVKFYENVFRIKPYMLETLKGLNALGVRCAVATASDCACAEAFINSNNLGAYICGVTSLDEVARPKSFPDIYLKAAEKLRVKPFECIVFEDALTAVKSAKSGGFYVCGVQDDCSIKDEAEIKRLSDTVLGFEKQRRV